MEKAGEPGSARYGNFINYYSFNPPERRVKLIPATFLGDCFGSCGHDTLLALDIGCNSGVRNLCDSKVLIVTVGWYKIHDHVNSYIVVLDLQAYG